VRPASARRLRLTSTPAIRYRMSYAPQTPSSNTCHTAPTRRPELTMNVISSWAQAFAWLIVFALLFELLLFRDLFNLFRSNRVAKPPQPPPYKTFRFLDLPDEIRNLIYEYALIEPNGLQYIEKHHTYNRKQHRVGHLTIINSPSTGTPTTLTLDPTVTQASCSHALTPSASGSPRPTPSSVSVYQIRGY
jgi:hypothetical protein